MTDNVRLSHTAHGALTIVNRNGFQIFKEYPTMQAAVEQATELGLIAQTQQSPLLQERGMAFPLSLNMQADSMNYDSLFKVGFTVSFKNL